MPSNTHQVEAVQQGVNQESAPVSNMFSNKFPLNPVSPKQRDQVRNLCNNKHPTQYEDPGKHLYAAPKKSEFSKELAYAALSSSKKALFHQLHRLCTCGKGAFCTESPLRKVWCINAFGGGENSFLYYLTSHFNHSCIPNAVWDITIHGHIQSGL
ncbi:hypothetical protein EG329_007360 [Mollisiaceae sp. DMI_Dod_QoI]|nr:hypothetical protein EG329_007360 [Helotiales sp. DMI_Dod_QoI]